MDGCQTWILRVTLYYEYLAELTPGDGAVSVFACACERYRCISPTAQRLVDLIGLIRNHSLHWRPERRYYLGVLKILRKRAIQVKEG